MLKNFLEKKFANRAPKKEIIVHIGAPKTGTSAIQNFSTQNRKALLNFGYHYPEHLLDNNGISGGHHALIAKPIIEQKIDDTKKILATLLANAKKQNSCLVLSAEGFYGQANTFGPLLREYNCLVLAWFRNPLDSFLSNYNQSIKRHYNIQSLSEVINKRLIDQHVPHLDGRYLHEWADVVGDENCTILPYITGSYKHKTSIEFQWLEALDITANFYPSFNFHSAAINRSYVPEALELKRLLNIILKRKSQKIAQCVDLAMQNYSDTTISNSSFFGNDIDSTEIKEFLNLFKESNHNLALRFPSLLNCIDISQKIKNEIIRENTIGLNLHTPLDHFRLQYPDEFFELKQDIFEILNENNASYEILKLADIFGISHSIPKVLVQLLPEKNLNQLLSTTAQPADMLREVALIMERSGNLLQASKIIERALMLRPNGQGIRNIYQRLKNSIKNND